MSTFPQISEAEFEVMKIVWKYAPINTNEITEKLLPTTNWSPKTIQTLIKRLVTKGALTYEKQSRVFVYTPAVKEDEYIRQQSSSFLNRYYDGNITAMVSVAWTFNSSILTFSFFQVFRTIFRFHELKVSSFCRHKKRLGSTTSHEHRRRKRLYGGLCALRKRSILIRNRVSAIYSLDFGYYHYDNISNPICSVPAFIKKICITS